MVRSQRGQSSRRADKRHIGGPFGPRPPSFLERASLLTVTTQRIMRGCDVDVDVSKTEAAEASLDAFVAQRDKARCRDEGERAREEIWRESVRRFNACRQQELAQQWRDYHDAQVRRHEVTYGLLLAHHRQERDRYAAMLEETSNGKDAA